MTWTNGTFFSFDLESTSADPLLAHTVSATLSKFVGGEPVDKRSWLIAPDVEVSPEAIEIHGLTNEHLQANGVAPKVALDEILTMLAQVLNAGLPLVVYNAAYDLTVVERQAREYGLVGLTDRVGEDRWSSIVDPFVMAQGAESFRTPEGRWGKRYKLPDVCARYGVEFVESHDAEADAIGAGHLAIALVNAYDFFASAGPNELTSLQKEWRDRIQSDLAAYFNRKNMDHQVDLGWPLHSTLTQA